MQLEAALTLIEWSHLAQLNDSPMRFVAVQRTAFDEYWATVDPALGRDLVLHGILGRC